MQITHDSLKQTLDHLTPQQLQQVADFIDFLQFRDRRHRAQGLPKLDPKQLASLATFAEEDRALAEAGMEDYATSLAQED
jgi:hypothetical protein